MNTIYNYDDTDLSKINIEIPSWIDQNITTHTIAAILEGGCSSGAYMPAVTYHEALATMGTYGNDVLDYIHENLGGEYEYPPKSESWEGIAVYYLSMAVELWAGAVEDEILEKLEKQTEATFLSATKYLLADSVRGHYVPQHFIHWYGETWNGFDRADSKIVKIGPTHPEYWEAWDEICRNAYYVDDDGQKWGLLEHDGDLWAIKIEN